MYKNIRLSYIYIALNVIALTACHTAKKNKADADNEQLNMHSAYDDSTLTNKILPVLMPYNRVIDPAGKVIAFGDPGDENHSMDVKLIPGSSLIVVEDRFGIAFIDTIKKKVTARWTYKSDRKYSGVMSTYSGLKVLQSNQKTFIFWSGAVSNGQNSHSYVFQAVWNGEKLSIVNTFEFKAERPSPLALPNEVAINNENGTNYLYVVLNGNNQLVKINLDDNKTVWTKQTGVAPYGITIVKDKIFVSNWAGTQPKDTLNRETAGVPYGSTYIDPKTGATTSGTVSVMGLDGWVIKEIPVGLHPNAIINSPDGEFVYVANGNSDLVSVIATGSLQAIDAIPVKLMPGKKSFIGDTPNALAINTTGTTLYVANGLDNAVAVVKLGVKAATKGFGKSEVQGFIPTEAYPGGLAIDGNTLFVTNLEGEGARVSSRELSNEEKEDAAGNADTYNSHHQKATVSIIQIPDGKGLQEYTNRVKKLNLTFREDIARLLPRKNIAPRPMPERIGEPSVFNHVLYIIKENRTYDQVLGDMPEGNGMKSLCIYGDSITPNQHNLARNFLLLDNYYASGKCSAEGHQWTDAAMVTDYVEKSVRAWFRSYPHVQDDALVYDANGFIWNNAADHGKTVRIYGEACIPHFDNKLSWTDIYNDYKAGKPFSFTNTSTISRVRPMLSQNFPASDEHRITEQLRASAFINELKDYESKPGDQLPQLMVMALSSDHTVGTRPGLPTPNAMVADNDLALGRIVEAVSKSRFWKNTVIFVTEDDSQAGWDHVSAYRTTGFIISPYNVLKRNVSTNYNQTSFVRSIEQILGIPPMNIMDATALPMFNCFTDKPSAQTYTALNNRVPINDINPKLAALKGPALHYAKLSLRPEYDHIDGGNDDVMNRILWFAAKGKKPYPAKLAGKDNDD
ncbi:bifunctional YncE family protein/alkaline phosphatase family protein [Mucilaginibacter xinganensis]|uniref:Phosphoesterase n=1 Tax=Mucilaginibacter xinganensis TaxID=1234841 RepID=A0A223NVC8_9SPHI|nr:alkaline phosphatase family protein [Mucilaginibacter xinganensis]ASU33588.1 phosphoesterase [Mucilaginibacter xinganensis]